MEDNIRNPRDFWDDFLGGAIPAALTPGYQWALRDTSPAGAPTIAFVSNGTALGELSFAMSSTSEATVLGIDFGDVLSMPIACIKSIEFLLRTPQVFNANSTFAFGLQSAFNADPTATAQHAYFRCNGNNLVRLGAKDGVLNTENNSNFTLANNVQTRFIIDFTRGKSNVLFFAGRLDSPLTLLNNNVVYSMANSTGQFQPFLQLTKSSGTQVDGFVVDSVYVDVKRA